MPVILVSLLCLLVFSALGQTTEEEYNYLTKGYEEQMNKGMDLKVGYRLDDVQHYVITNETVNGPQTTDVHFKAFYREGEPYPCAHLAIYKEISVEGKERLSYICIPHIKSSDEIWEATSKSLNKLGKNDTQVLTMNLMRLLTDLDIK